MFIIMKVKKASQKNYYLILHNDNQDITVLLGGEIVGIVVLAQVQQQKFYKYVV